MWFKDYHDDEQWRYSKRTSPVPDYDAMAGKWQTADNTPSHTDEYGKTLSIRYLTEKGKKRTALGHYFDGAFRINHRAVNAIEWAETIFKYVVKEYK
jgi:hypothetical protein